MSGMAIQAPPHPVACTRARRVPPPGGSGARCRSWWLVIGVLVVGCSEEEPPPVQAARQFVQAVQAGEIEPVLALVDAEAKAHVEQAAEQASDQVGGRRSIAPQEMLQVVDVDPYFQIKEAELVQGDDRQAQVRLTGADGATRVLDLINENGSWRVNLPLPRAPMIDMIEMVETVEP